MTWSSTEKGTILSAFFWGYMVMQIPAGILASRYGPSYLLAGSIFTCGVLTALTPLAAIYGGWISVEVTRILQGLLQVFSIIKEECSRPKPIPAMRRFYVFSNQN
jgi:MFS family permease